MKMKNVFTILAMALMIAGTALAHHSFSAEYDQTKPIKITGKVTGMKWANPHAWMYVDVETEGKVVSWSLESGAANQLIRRGWKKEDLPVGTVLVIEGWQARNGSPTANVSSVTFTDGRKLFSNQAPPKE